MIRVRRATRAALAAALALSCGRSDTTARTQESAGGVATPSARLLATGDSLYNRDEYDSARVILERAAESAGRAGDSVVLARVWTSLAILARRQGRFDDAQTIGDRSVALKQRLGLSADLARSFNLLGNVANDRGDFTRAVSLFRSTLSAAAAAHDSVYLSRAHGNVGLAFTNEGQFDSARVEFQAFRDAAAARGDARDEANALNNLGMLESRVQRPARAIEWLNRARQRYQDIHYAVGEENSLGQLGLAYQQLGQTVRAFAYLDSALAIATRNGLVEPEADDLQAIAELYENLGDHRHALESLRRARSLDDSLGFKSKAGLALLTESRAYENLGMMNLAASRAREAVDLQQQAGAKLDELNARLIHAELEQRSGASTAATSEVARAAVLADSLGSGVARIRLALGSALVHDVARRDAQVLSTLERISGDTVLLSAEERGEFHDLEARALYRRKQLDAAVRAGRAAVAAAEQIRGGIASAPLRTSYISSRSRTYADLVLILLAMGKSDDAFRVADAARGRALIEQLGSARKDAPRRGTPAGAAAADSLLGRIDELLNRLRTVDSSGRRSTTRPDRGFESVERELALTRSAYDSVVEHFAEQDPNGPILGTYTVDVAALRNSLAPDERLLDYFETDDRLVVFVLSRQSLAVVQVPGSRDSLAVQVRTARDVVAQRGAMISPSLGQLYAKLIEPIERRGLLRGVGGLIIVPHGSLTYLPFAALRDSASGRYLVERYSLLTLTSASALVPLRRRVAPGPTGNAGVFAPLPGALPATGAEAAAVSQVLGVRADVGSDASERAVRLRLRNASVVHLATHGTVDPDHPLFSGVQLAAAPGRRSPDDDGLLETHEVLAMDVKSPLVFLSGCETALGTYRPAGIDRGEDYATLSQAFLFAGARNVVATLWRIDDQGASEFARRFYVNMTSRSPASALASAQRELMRDPRYSAPYYWAGYVISGGGSLQ